MLRISARTQSEGLVRLQLDGQITGQWVKLLEGTCEAQLNNGTRVVLDLKNVSFLDRPGAALLRSLAERQVQILNALPFIAAQIAETGQ